MKRIVFMGTPDFAVPILEKLVTTEYEVVLVVTQPDRPKGRKKVLTPPPVKETAVQYKIPVFQPERIKEDYAEILAYEPDIIVTAAYGQILPKELLEAPTYGCINVHASLLPELRGGAPIHYAILEGKKETGITIMYMVEALDAGDIIAQKKIPIFETDHVGTLHDKLAEVGAQLLLNTLPNIFNRSITAVQQNDEDATYAPNIKRSEERIDWSKDHQTVYNHIRGLHPWPVAYTTLNGEVLKVWWGERDDQTYDGEPGEIVKIIDEEAIVVACGDRKGIRLTSIQPAGRKKMSTADFLRGSSDLVRPGIILGE